MFRAQASNFDAQVAKATDENLTSENWALILEVCDSVAASPAGPSSAIAALIKRLAHRNANVQLYTLELANALSQNCGRDLYRELASRSFTDALLRLANDRNTHQQVKSKVLERMHEWSDMFRGDPDLGIMEQAYDKLRRGNPGLVAPSKPVKREIEDTDRRKEDEELQMALALSLKEKAASPTQTQGTDAAQPDPQSVNPAGTTAATVSRVRALYDFTPSEPGELAFRKNDIIAVLESVYKDWWKGSLKGQTGIFPLNYVEKLQDPTREELERDAGMEGEVFAQIRNVEKLLALLSVRGEGGMGGSRNDGNEEEITELYNQTLAIRPKLIELIGKYSQKKDDFTQLNEKFIKARRDYEALLESSMSQPPAAYGGRQRHSSQPYYNAYGPPQGVLPQGAPLQGYPQQQYPPQGSQASQGHQGQDAQRFFATPLDGPPSTNYTYPPQVNGTPAPSAAFHFMPGGAPPPDSRQTPKPDTTFSPQHPQQYATGRPQSIHTLNSGNPQELATGGYESPVDNRAAAYPPSYPANPPQQQAPPPPQQMPIRQRTASFESPTSQYSSQTPLTQDSPYPTLGPSGQQHQQRQSYPPAAQQQQQQHQQQQGYPQQPAHAPPGVGGAPGAGYQAYNPSFAPPAQPQHTGGPPQPHGGGDSDDASNYYR